uniref:Nuclear pore membrane glycoprotein n=1 Tax=Panagrellus redivivus TaxID=6233 RepID=A0A7E4VU03_PANRE
MGALFESPGGGAIALLIGLFLVGFAEASSGYKLNVPRVLLPYHPTTQASYTLEVTGGGCFHWRSTRPEIVSVEPLNDADGCADRAIVTSKTVYEEEQSSVIIAENKGAAVSLSCVVIVDVIDRIAISTVSSVLFVDAAPAQMVVEAINKDGHRFFNLTDIPFDWFFEYPDGGKPVRIVPFAQSKYEAPVAIQRLEFNKQRGFVVLVEGVSTGFARLTAKFAEPHFSAIASDTIDLSVVANVILNPSHDIYLPVHASVRFGATIIKQNGNEDVILPSPDYHIALNNPSVASLDTSTSTVTAVSTGRTEVILIDRHVKPKSGIKPQSAHIHVSEPDAIVFTIDKGNVWYIQSGIEYKINVRLQDTRGNYMYITDNMVFQTSLPTDHFTIIEASPNGNYFHVRATKTGVVTLKSTFTEIQTATGPHRLSSAITGEQVVTISDKLEVKPYIVAFPHHPTKPYVYQLTATGGTGSYRWSTSDTKIAAVDESRGRLTSGALGHTVVRVEDVFNVAHFALVQVYVLESAELRFGESHVEAEVGDKLILNVRMSGLDPSSGKLIPFSDCRNTGFGVTVGDVAVFKKDRAASQRPEFGGCATIPLVAQTSGDTTVKLVLDQYNDEITISAFPPLQLSLSHDLLLATGSEYHVDYTGGPRPWILDQTKHFTDAETPVKTVTVANEGNTYALKCGSALGEAQVTVKIGNRKSSKNPLPVVSTAKISVCCAQPQRIALTTKPGASAKNIPSCPAFTHSVYHSRPAALQLVAWGVCGDNKDAEERLFDSLSAVKVKYSVAQTTLLSVKGLGVDEKQPSRHLATAVPKSQPGTAKITAEATFGKQPFKASLILNLVDHAVALPPSLVLWNAKSVRGTSVLSGGSGHFWVDADSVAEHVSAHVIAADGQAVLELHPTNQGLVKVPVFDLCIEGSRFDVAVKVTDVTAIRIQGPELVEVGATVPLTIEVLDVEGHPFSIEDVKMMELNIDYSREVADLRANDLLSYDLKGTSVGIGAISAKVRSSTGQVVRSVPHQVQVFAPLRLLPSVVTLIPESVFQFEILGGPQAQQADVQFILNTSGIATVAQNGLITSNLNLGETAVTAAVTTGGSAKHIVTQDSAQIRVVSLAGIRIVVSSVIVEAGDRIWATIHGLDDAETPFAFGGAEYPLTVQWKLSSKDNLVFESPLTEIIDEEISNRFTAYFYAQKAGLVRLEAVVNVHKRSAKHFAHGATVFKDTIQLTVQDSLRLPSTAPKALLLTPSTSLELSANRPSQHVSYKLAKSSIATLVGRDHNILQTGPSEGSLPLQITHRGSAFNETAFVTVDVLNVYSLHLTLEHSLISAGASSVAVLPQGITVRVRASFRDQRGRVFDAAANTLRFRPHRFDLTDIVAKDANRTLDITLKRAGETVIRVWDPTNPRVSAFVRLPVGDVLSPIHVRDFFVGDLVCFDSPVGSSITWSTTGSSNRILRFIQGNAGRAVLNSAGDTSVFAKLNPAGQNATTFAAINVHSPDVLVFAYEPKLVSNIAGKPILFPVRFGAKANETLNNVHGCFADELSSFADVRPPFDCTVALRGSAISGVTGATLFAAKPVFDEKLGSYACRLRDQPFDVPSHQQLELDGAELVISATWVEAPQASVSVAVPFFPRFTVHDSEILLNNLGDDTAILSITAVPGLEASIRVEPCAGNMLTIERIADPLVDTAKGAEPVTIVGNMHFKVILNVNSAALWAERTSGCELTITSVLTEQADPIPVNIKLHGDVAKAAIIAYRHNGILGFFTYAWEQFFPFVATIILAISAFMLFFTYRRATASTADISYYPSDRIGGQNVSYSFSGVKPLFTSTPENSGPAPAIAECLASKFRNRSPHRAGVTEKLFEEQSSLNTSIGSSMDPNSWTNDTRLGVLNRRYR